MVLETGIFRLGGDQVAESLQGTEFNVIPEGKSIISKAGYFSLNNETITLHTVTTDKVLYVKQLFLKTGTLSAGAGFLKVGDNVSAALAIDTIYSDAVVLFLLSPSDTPPIITFPVPLKILTSLTVYTPSTISETLLGFIGWEENA